MRIAPAGLCRCFGLRPYSVRAVLVCAPVEIEHRRGKPLVDVERFAAALRGQPMGAVPRIMGFTSAARMVDFPSSEKAREVVTPPGPVARFGSERGSSPTQNLKITLEGKG